MPRTAKIDVGTTPKGAHVLVEVTDGEGQVARLTAVPSVAGELHSTLTRHVSPAS